MNDQPMVSVPLVDLQRALFVLKVVIDATDPQNTGQIHLYRVLQNGATVAYRHLEPIEQAWLAAHPDEADG
jgi:hypothetical protein